MTFRTRLVLAATGAVLVVVVLGAIATYLVASSSLTGSIDVTIQRQSLQLLSSSTGANPAIANVCGSTAGACSQVVLADGTTDPADPTVLPIGDPVRRSAASKGQQPDTYFTTTVGGISLRELVTALPPGFSYRGNTGYRSLAQGGALQVTAPLTGVAQELHSLAIALWIIVLVGILLAVGLGFAVGQTVLRPLNSLTASIEELAETTDVSQRLDSGGPDELGRLRRAFNRLLVALDTSRESQRQLVLDASHELRTPLTSLRTNMEVARRFDELESEDRDVLIGDVLTQLDELTSLVADLAELARGEQPQRVREPLRMDDIVLQAVAAATTHGRGRNVTFRAHTSPCWVYASAARIERAIDNLLDNALKWSPDDGVVEVVCERGTLLVRDHGPGVDDADAEHIFDRFYRAPSARSRPGSGLGLAIVAQVVQEEGGSVAVARAEGGGALFRFTLPEAEPPATWRPDAEVE